MMNLSQTLIPTYSIFLIALSTLLYVTMSWAVIYFRFKEKVAFGIGSDPKSSLARMNRVHGNFAEYAPIYLIELVALEISGEAKVFIAVLGGLFVFSRLMHWKGIFHHKTPNLFRATGMLITFSGLLVMSFRLIWICIQ